MEGTRPARDSDVERVATLARALRAELVAVRGGELWGRRDARVEPLERTLVPLLERHDAHVVVGTVDGAVMGFGIVELETLRDGDRLAVITELFVEPQARAVGIGEAMLGALLAFSAEHGCIGVDSLALPGQRETKNFFEGHGFTARALVVHRRTP